MDQIFAFIVLVLTWHMYVDDSITKGPQNNQFFLLQMQHLVKNSSNTAILSKTNGLLVTNGQDCWSYCPGVGLAHAWR